MRDIFWNYPQKVLAFAREFKTVLGIVVGLGLGVLIVYSLSGIIRRVEENNVMNQTLRVGYVGTLHHINPLDIGAGEAEKMVTKLVYNGLVAMKNNGEVTPELAETWEISPNGREYTFFIKRGIYWHDGREVTAEDVAFTYEFLKSSGADSGLGAIAEDLSIRVTGPYSITFSLPQINAAFFELLTLPILPKHLYEGFTYSRFVEQGDFILPVGTGLYKISSQKDNEITLISNESYYRGQPSIKRIKITVYSSFSLAEAAFLRGEITMLSPVAFAQIPEYTKFTEQSQHIQLKQYEQANNTRVLLFNLHKSDRPSAVKTVNVRKAIAQSINRESFSKVFPGMVPAYGPYSQVSDVYQDEIKELLPYSTSDANALLEKELWKYEYSGAQFRSKGESELQFTITFLDTESNKMVAQSIKNDLANIGVNATLRGVTDDVFQQQVIAQHEFEVLLFEIQTGVDPDQYGLWHSSQAEFPGLNIGGFSSSKVNTLLEKGRLQVNRDKRKEIYRDFQKELISSVPAIFLYHPVYYELSYDSLDRQMSDTITRPQDRFEGIKDWVILPGWRNRQTR